MRQDTSDTDLLRWQCVMTERKIPTDLVEGWQISLMTEELETYRHAYTKQETVKLAFLWLDRLPQSSVPHDVSCHTEASLLGMNPSLSSEDSLHLPSSQL